MIEVSEGIAVFEDRTLDFDFSNQFCGKKIRGGSNKPLCPKS